MSLVYVYNSDTDEVRIVVIMPSDDWGGDGLLGADAAHGYLHRLPTSCCNTTGKSTLLTADIESIPVSEHRE